jgi:hypothetical protein
LSPFTFRVKEVGVTEGPRLTVIVEDVEAGEAGGVTGLKLNVVETPAGGVGTLSVTGELKPFSALRDTIEVPDAPTPRLRVEGLAEKEKSG